MKKFLFFTLSSLFFNAVANADPALPGSANAGVVGQSLSNPQPLTTNALHRPPVLSGPTEQNKKLIDQAKKIKFKLKKIVLMGNHVYSTQQLSIFYQQYLGKVISVADLFTIQENITNFYRDSGYILSRSFLPPQHVTNGEVTIKILEGSIGQVTIGGHPGGARCLLQVYGNKIRDSRPLQLKVLEKYLLLANQMPSTAVTAQLNPDKNLVGTSDLTLVTQHKLITGYLSYDNYGTRYLGPQELSGNMTFNSLLASGDALSMSMTKTTKGHELTYQDANYSTVMDNRGDRWLIGVNRTISYPLFVLRPEKINGENRSIYATLIFPVITKREETLDVRVGFTELNNLDRSFGQLLYNDHVRPLDVGTSWSYADSYKGNNTLSGDLRLGLPIWGDTLNTNPDTALTSRPGGSAKFAKIVAQAARTQVLNHGFSFQVLGTGQTTTTPLLTSEQFSFGGSQLGRGYDVGEMLGDKALAGSGEIRYDFKTPPYINPLQFYVFYDAGVLWNIITDAGVLKKQSATSTGFGVRFGVLKYLSGNLMWTQVLTKKIAAEALIGNGYRPREFYSLTANFDFG